MRYYRKVGCHDLELDQLISKLRFSSEQVENVPGFKKIAAELTQKADSLQNQSFTVALFGAFSAGKSSFANALIGDRFYLFHRIQQLLRSIKLCLLMQYIHMDWY